MIATRAPIRKSSHFDPDTLAEKLIEWSLLAKSMPPAWDGACVSSPILFDPEGRTHGAMLPGKGLLLDRDLRSLGITQPIPHVFELSPVARGAEGLAKLRHATEILIEDDRAAISSYDQIINARANGNAFDRVVAKLSAVTVANQWSSLFQSGGLPAAGVYSGTPGTAPNNATTGALSLGLPNPSGGNAAYLLTFGFNSSSAINMLMLADLLAQVGGLVATSALAQTVSSVALTRYTSGSTPASATPGAGVMATLDVSTAIGTTASNVNLSSYTNQAGTAARVSPVEAMTVSAIVQRLLPIAAGPFMPLQSGDFGIRAVSTITLSAAMTAGVFALNLYYPLMWLPGIVANTYIERDSTAQIDGLTNLVLGSDSALGCLVAYVQTNSTSSGILNGFMRTCQG